MIVSKHIANLLHQHDCVVVPNFGSFFKHEQPADLIPAKELIFPPHSAVQFTEQLLNDDQLLAEEIAQKDQINLDTANEKINNFVNEVSQALIDNKLYRIEEIGKLYVNEQNNIAFKASDTNSFSKTNFGLPRLRAKKVNRTEQERQKVEQFIAKGTEKLSPLTALFTVAATVLALLLAGSLYLLNEGSENEQQFIRNTFGSFIYANAGSPSFSEPQTPDTVKYGTEINAPDSGKTELKQAREDDPFQNTKNDAVSVFEEPTANVETKSSQSATENQTGYAADFHVVVGMFTQEANAHKVQTTAQSKGYQSTIKKGRKYYRVVIPFSSSDHTWVQAQQQLANDITPDAWIWESRFK